MNQIAEALLQTQSVHINTQEYFTWTSGKKSPIYCDNRQLISYPHYRTLITQEFVKKIKTDFSQVELIAGTATAGIPWAAWIAESLNLPMIYIRSKPKGHGLKSAIEGKALPSQKTLIIEDLISTGKSSIEAVHNAKNDKLEVLGVLSIFTYGFSQAENAFQEQSIEKYSLCHLDQLLQHAQATQTLNSSNVDQVLEWKKAFI
ncbi:MAG: orotate phosphoribosyltransferase [Bacteriovoracaceae bacterium]|jgi:orotate phosphoribosyltransferase|nr:orotate phosphoribosyltransferase [Halobacteriovoraceae bacterium]MDP7319851.1 orotate phosphoribosyltransferase [Bacteriovoracaceae bacterium]|tara:strand:+ start:391 stop:999 length:609 start_codon:yes stop_codon:yes gene_type:complete